MVMPSKPAWPFSLKLISPNVVHVEIHKSDADICLDDLKKLTTELGIIGEEKKLYVIVDILKHNTISKEGRAYSASEESQIYTKANAIIISSLAMRIGANFFININKPVRPTRVFNSVDQALEWFKELEA